MYLILVFNGCEKIATITDTSEEQAMQDVLYYAHKGYSVYVTEKGQAMNKTPRLSKAKICTWLDTLNYWVDYAEDYGDRYPDVKPMVDKFNKVIDEIYELYKELPDEQI